MDFSYVLDHRLAVGGGIWTAETMAELKRHGFTHIVNLQMEFDEADLAAGAGLSYLWNPTDDDMAPKPEAFFDRSVRFALAALDDSATRVYVHCAAGIHRAPLTAAAILVGLGFSVPEAIRMIVSRRIGCDFPEIYTDSLRAWAAARDSASSRDSLPEA